MFITFYVLVPKLAASFGTVSSTSLQESDQIFLILLLPSYFCYSPEAALSSFTWCQLGRLYPVGNLPSVHSWIRNLCGYDDHHDHEDERHPLRVSEIARLVPCIRIMHVVSVDYKSTVEHVVALHSCKSSISQTDPSFIGGKCCVTNLLHLPDSLALAALLCWYQPQGFDSKLTVCGVN